MPGGDKKKIFDDIRLPPIKEKGSAKI